jgi:hypothetical protein
MAPAPDTGSSRSADGGLTGDLEGAITSAAQQFGGQAIVKAKLARNYKLNLLSDKFRVD